MGISAILTETQERYVETLQKFGASESNIKIIQKTLRSVVRYCYKTESPMLEDMSEKDFENLCLFLALRSTDLVKENVIVIKGYLNYLQTKGLLSNEDLAKRTEMLEDVVSKTRRSPYVNIQTLNAYDSDKGRFFFVSPEHLEDVLRTVSGKAAYNGGAAILALAWCCLGMDDIVNLREDQVSKKCDCIDLGNSKIVTPIPIQSILQGYRFSKMEYFHSSKKIIEKNIDSSYFIKRRFSNGVVRSQDVPISRQTLSLRVSEISDDIREAYGLQNPITLSEVQMSSKLYDAEIQSKIIGVNPVRYIEQKYSRVESIRLIKRYYEKNRFVQDNIETLKQFLPQ